MGNAERLLTLVPRNRDDEVVQCGSVLGHQIALGEQLAQDDVSHAEPDRGQRLSSYQLEQVIVPPATADRPQIALAVEELEDDPRVVCEPANDPKVDLDVLSQIHRTECVHVRRESLQLGPDVVAGAETIPEGIEPCAVEQVEYAGRLRVVEPGVGHEGLHRLFPWPTFQLVHHAERRGEPLLRDAMRGEQRREKPSIGHPSVKMIRGETELTDSVDRHGQDLGVRGKTFLSNDIHVPLEVLPQPPALLTLVAEELGDREPPDRLAHRSAPVTEDPGERGRHLRTQRHRTVSLVREGVQLVHDLVATLLDVEIEGFKRRTVVLEKAVAPGNPAPRVNDVRTKREVFRWEVPEAWKPREARGCHGGAESSGGRIEFNRGDRCRAASWRSPPCGRSRSRPRCPFRHPRPLPATPERSPRPPLPA